MLCCEEITIEKFTDLQPGDHIATRGQMGCLGRFYDHHAIVINIDRKDGDKADIQVVDVARKGDGWKYSIEKHSLLDYKAWRLPTGMCRFFECEEESGVKTQKIKRIDYCENKCDNKRRNTREKTKEIALSYADSDEIDLKYCILGQNCEHFASACVNGQKSSVDLKKSMSVQSRNCGWRIMHILFLLLQGIFYGLNFSIYAVFVAKDKSYDIFSPGIHSFLQHVCYNPNNVVPGFNTTCDWKIIAIFLVMFVFIFAIALFAFYQPLYAKGFICKQCLIIARLDCFSKLFTFVIIEAVSIYLENPSYKIVTRWHAGNWVFAVVFGISFIGAFLVYSVSSLLTWVLGMCCVPTCEEVGTFTQYFRFRGLASLLVCLVRCFRQLFEHNNYRNGYTRIDQGPANDDHIVNQPKPGSDAE